MIAQLQLLDPSAIFWFAVLVAALDRFDISLPRGDSVGVSGSVVAAAVVLLGVPSAALVAGVGAAFALVRRPDRDRRAITNTATAKLAAFALVGLVWQLLPADVPALAQMLNAFVVVAAYLVSELLVSQAVTALQARRPFLRLVTGNLSRQGMMLAAQLSAGLLVILVYPSMGTWSLLPVGALLVLIRQSYAMLLEMRDTYGMTVAVLVEAAEGQDSQLQGHAERSAFIARSIGTKLGLGVAEIERLGYCALLHDVDAIGEADREDSAGSSTVLEGVAFFEEVLPVLRICDGKADVAVDSHTLTLALVVALASDIDATQSGISALSHHGCNVASLASRVPNTLKARVVAAAIELGYEIPGVS